MENLEILVNKTQTINIILWIQFQKWKFFVSDSLWKKSSFKRFSFLFFLLNYEIMLLFINNKNF